MIGLGPGGAVKGSIRAGRFRPQSGIQSDGSIVHAAPTNASQHLRSILSSQGLKGQPLEEIVSGLPALAPNRPTQITQSLTVTNWQVREVTTDLDQPRVSQLLFVKIAFEFVAGHVTDGIYSELSNVESLRMSLIDGTELPDWVEFEYQRFDGKDFFHFIALESGTPHITVQLRLFGSIGVRIHFRDLEYGGPRFAYFHSLPDGAEHFERLDGPLDVTHEPQ